MLIEPAESSNGSAPRLADIRLRNHRDQVRFEIASTANTVAAYLSSITRHLLRCEEDASSSRKESTESHKLNEEILSLAKSFQARKKHVVDVANEQLETISRSAEASEALLTRTRGVAQKDAKLETEDSERRKKEVRLLVAAQVL